MKDSSAQRRESRTPSSPVSDDETDEEPPKPVSSGDEDDDASSNSRSSQNTRTTTTATLPPPTSSRLFAPYRSIGVILTNRFHLVPHQSSAQAIVACPIGDRFQLVQTNRLHPILVSHSVPQNGTIQKVVTDPSLSITIAVYAGGSTSTTKTAQGSSSFSVALFQRTRVIQTIRLVASSSSSHSTTSIADIQSMGHVRQAVADTGKNETENAAVIAVLVRQHEEDRDTAIPTVGDDDMSVEDEDSMDATHTSALGELVILIAMRRGMRVRSRMDLSSIRPRVCVHPSTYVNKLLIGGDGGACLVNIRSNKLIHTFQCLESSSSSTITSMEQAPAVDTIAMGTLDGKVHLVNIRVDQLLFTLTHKPTSPITSLSFRTDASALHYGISPLAVGCGDGTIFVWDLHKNEAGSRTVLCEMNTSTAGTTSCQLQFFPQEPLLLVAGHNSLHMYVFDQPDHQPRLLRHRSGHTQPPAVIQYTQHQSRVATAMDGTDAAACQIVSTGGHDRTVRLFSTARSVLDTELSQGGGLERKAKQWKLQTTDRTELLLPKTTAIALADSVRDWGNMVTIHQHHAFAYVWSTTNKSQSGPLLRQDHWKVGGKHRAPPRSAHATSVALSACGNFALVGTVGGTIYKYNMESGLARGSYPANDSNSGKKKKNRRLIGSIHRTTTEIEKKLKVVPSNKTANVDRQILDQQEQEQRRKALQAKLRSASHDGYAVTGLAVDTMNRVLISVGADGKLILWHLHSHAPHTKSPFRLPCGATQLVHVRESDLAAIALENHSVLLFDCAALTIVRRFGGTTKYNACHQQAISDMAFSQDGRMLFTSSFDCTIRVWDVPTNACVDWLAFASPPTSIAVSPTGEFLATTHTDQLGLSIWSDKSYYQTVHLGTAGLESPIQMHKPIPVSDDGLEQNKEHVKTVMDIDDDSGDLHKAGKEPVLPKEPGLVTLSGQPVTHWKNLFHLDLVKARNQPKEPPKKPPSAPFFLQHRGSQPPALQAKEDNKQSGVDDEWAAAWSDDDNDNTTFTPDGLPPIERDDEPTPEPKRRKRVTLARSNLARLLADAAASQSKSSAAESSSLSFREVTEYIASLGASAIDVELTSLCHGAHDLEDGLPLLLAACRWLTEACQSHERFEAVNAYLNRYLHLHASTIASLNQDEVMMESDDVTDNAQCVRRELLGSLKELRGAQAAATGQVKEKLEHALCLLRHFSRIV